jgi:D-alanine transaminase
VVAPEDAQVSVMDRGFLFGDGVYEVVPVYSRHPFRLDAHLGRLGRIAWRPYSLENPHTHRRSGRHWLSRLVATAEWDDHSVYIQVTRGPDGGT